VLFGSVRTFFFPIEVTPPHRRYCSLRLRIRREDSMFVKEIAPLVRSLECTTPFENYLVHPFFSSNSCCNPSRRKKSCSFSFKNWNPLLAWPHLTVYYALALSFLAWNFFSLFPFPLVSCQPPSERPSADHLVIVTALWFACLPSFFFFSKRFLPQQSEFSPSSSLKTPVSRFSPVLPPSRSVRHLPPSLPPLFSWLFP